MAAGAPGPLCGGGVGRELPSPERPTLRTRVPHHHLVPRPPGVPGPDWGRGRPAPLGEGRSRGSGLERLGGWGHKCRGGVLRGLWGGTAVPRCSPARPGGRSHTAFGPDGAAPGGGLAGAEGKMHRVCRRDVRRGPQPSLLGPSVGALAPRAWGAVRGGVSPKPALTAATSAKSPAHSLPVVSPPPPSSRNWMRCDTPGFSPTFWDGPSLSWPKRPLDRPGRLERFNCLVYRCKNFLSPLLAHKWRKTPPPFLPLSSLNLLFVMAF